LQGKTYTMQDKINNILSSEFNVSKTSSLLVACSGGMDSMVLSHILMDLGYSIQLAHVNYNLRGEDSILDKKLVEDFAIQHNIKLHVHNVYLDDALQDQAKNLQAEARRIRYEFFENIAAEKQMDFILTAHHLDDQLESLIFNLKRKMHLGKLNGIPRKRGNILRPMLDISRDEIRSYCNSNKVAFREDSSNAENKYARNKIRNNIVHPLKINFPDFHDGFNQSMDNFRSGLAFFEESIKNWTLKVTREEDASTLIDIPTLKMAPEPRYLLYLLLSEKGFKMETTDQLYKSILKNSTGAIFENNNYQLLLNRKQIICIPKSELQDFEQVEWIEQSKAIQFKNKVYEKQLFSTWERPFKLNKEEALFDSKEIKFPLIIRSFQPGDRIKPFGMGGKQKKVKKLFTDLKINRIEKKNIPIVLDAREEIIWIPGYCHSSAHQINQDTKEFLYLKIKKET